MYMSCKCHNDSHRYLHVYQSATRKKEKNGSSNTDSDQTEYKIDCHGVINHKVQKKDKSIYTILPLFGATSLYCIFQVLYIYIYIYYMVSPL